MDGPPTLLRLPNELLEAIALYLSLDDTEALGSACRRTYEITREPLAWRRRCAETWKFWHRRHEVHKKLHHLPPLRTKWRQLYNHRMRIDEEVARRFEEMLSTRQARVKCIREIVDNGDDVRDLMLCLAHETPDSADDVLARTYHASLIIGQMNRIHALQIWSRLQQGSAVELEDAIGAFDVFVHSPSSRGDLGDIKTELDRLSSQIEEAHADIWSLSPRERAVRIAQSLRSLHLLGNPNLEDYHALRNNFIGIAMFADNHTSLPLQSVVIYCAVARRLGLDARPSNYPRHAHAVIVPPDDVTIDGERKPSLVGADSEVMFMDPWRSSDEVPLAHLRRQLLHMRIPPNQYAHYLGPSGTFEATLRTCNNMLTSFRQPSAEDCPDKDRAWYGMLWCMFILGDIDAAKAVQQRRILLNLLIDHFRAHFLEDLELLNLILPLLKTDPEHDSRPEYNGLQALIRELRANDTKPVEGSPRDARAANVCYKVGQHFQHTRFGYKAFIVGWDVRCAAKEPWIQEMGVDNLPRGREQPFYHVV